MDKRRRTDNTMDKRRRTDITMDKRRRTDITMDKRRTDITMDKRRRKKGQITIYKALHRKLKIEQREAHRKSGVISGGPNG
jgi:hypothetical protein